MIPSAFPHLSTLILFPWLAAAGLAFIRDVRKAKLIALGSAVFELLLSLSLLARFDFTSDKMQFTERHAWIPSLDIDYALGVDGLSVLFPACTALLTLAVLLASWTSVQSMARLYLGFILFLEGITTGVFCALDMALFFLFWELTLIPIYFLISLWGIGPRRRAAATQYTLFMLVGGAFLLFGIIVLALNHAEINDLSVPAGMTFNYLDLLATQSTSETQTVVFFLLFLGFAIKTPLFPFHTWLPMIAMEGPTGLTALLTGLKLGAYALLRFAVPLAPEAAIRYRWLLAGLGAIGLVYGALLALRQSNLRRLLAYASISHVGVVVVALSTMNIQGVQGAIFQLVNFSLISAGLFLLAGFLRQRLGSTELTSLGGLAQALPLLTSCVFVLGLAGIGVPGTNGFAAELLIILGTFEAHTGLGLAILLGMILNAAYFLGFFRRAFLGPVARDHIHQAMDLRPRELIIAASLATLCLVIGSFPRMITSVTETTALAWVKRAGGAFPDHPSAFAKLDEHDGYPRPDDREKR